MPLRLNKQTRILLWTLAWIALILVSLETALSKGWPWRIPELEPYILLTPHSDWTHNAFEIQKLKRFAFPESDTNLVFMGGSCVLEAIPEDTHMEDLLSQYLHGKISFRSLCATDQSFADSAKILKELGCFEGIALLALHPRSFIFEKDAQLFKTEKKTNLTDVGLYYYLRYYFLSPTEGTVEILENQGVNVGLNQKLILFRTASVLGDNLKKRLLRFFHKGLKFEKTIYDRHFIGRNIPPVNGSDRKELSRKIVQDIKKYALNGQLNLDLLEEVVSVAKANNNQLILVDMPTNPLFKKEMSLYYRHYDKMLNIFLKKSQVGYIDMRKAVFLAPEDFRDLTHMRTTGAQKFSEAFAEKISRYIKTQSKQ